jgi:hypothetical protein
MTGDERQCSSDVVPRHLRGANECSDASRSSSRMAQIRSIHQTPVASVAEPMCLADACATFFHPPPANLV